MSSHCPASCHSFQTALSSRAAPGESHLRFTGLSDTRQAWEDSGVERIRVESSSLASVGYSLESQTLEVEFRNGRVYRYTGVPAAVHGELMDAESKGAFFNQRIRDTYPSQRV